MGLFDEVRLRMLCPQCQAPIIWFQTKDLGRGLNRFDFSQIPVGTLIYTDCGRCGMWVELTKGVGCEKMKERFKQKLVFAEGVLNAQ